MILPRKASLSGRQTSVRPGCKRRTLTVPGRLMRGKAREGASRETEEPPLISSRQMAS